MQKLILNLISSFQNSENYTLMVEVSIKTP